MGSLVLIISSDSDASTNDVIDWLLFYKIPFLRVSDEKEIELETLSITKYKVNFTLKINGYVLNSSDIMAVWYRRSSLNINKPNTEFKKIPNDVVSQLLSELEVANEVIQESLRFKNINHQYDNRLNKIIVLQKVMEIKLDIPKTIVTGNKKDLAVFFESNNGKIITKNFTQGIFIKYNNQFLNSLTSKVNNKDISKMHDVFFPSLFQELIEKMFDLRIFFINKKLFCAAIFSQNDKKTSIDFRNYNYEKPNRVIPYKLPISIEKKIFKLMYLLKINSGSIDMIVDKNRNHYFLEVNPIGQFSQISNPCNFHISKYIAEEIKNIYESSI